MFRFKSKEVYTPDSESSVELEAVELWEVRWLGRYGSFNSNTQPEVECFTNELDARRFKEALIKAFELTRNTENHFIKISKKVSPDT